MFFTAMPHRAVVPDLPDQFAACASGRELHAAGFGHDVDVAAGADRGVAVSDMDGLVFRAA